MGGPVTWGFMEELSVLLSLQKSYRSKVKINICQSSQQLELQMSGHGLQPQLEFSPSVLELGPSLPCSRGAEGTVVVKNPCDFPIEFYSLEFDQQYLAEEQVRGKVWSHGHTPVAS